ncbi:hypothetical protein Tco_1483612 [Tanacetum coccineum]
MLDAPIKNLEVKEVKKELVPCDLPIVNPYVEPIVLPIPNLGHLKEQEDEAQAFRILEGLKKAKINRPMILDEDIFTCDINVHVSDSSRKDDHRMISSDKAKHEVHWCEPTNEESDQLWASCDPCTKKCDNKTRREDIRNLWAYSYNDKRIKIPWKDMPFEN